MSGCRGSGGGRRHGGGGRRSDSCPDHSSPAPDQSANRGGRGGRGRGYGSPDAGGSRPAPEFHAPANFPPLSSLSTSIYAFPPLASPSPSTSTFAASLSREFDKSLTLQSPSSTPVRRQPSDPVRPQPQNPALRPAQTHPTTTVPSQPQPQTPAPRPAQTHPTTPVPSQPQPQASTSSSSSEQVTEIEVSPSTSKAITFPRRPGFGALGKKCAVRANHFQVEVEDRDYYHYDVSFFLHIILFHVFVLIWLEQLIWY